MENKPNLPDPITPEEPPLQQTPDMLNQKPTQEYKMPEERTLEKENQQVMQAKRSDFSKRKTWIIVVMIIAGLVIASVIAGLVYWTTVLTPINDAIEEQNTLSQTMDSHRIEDTDELVSAYQSESALDCSYSVAIDGEIFDIIEEADNSWKAHKVTAISDDTMMTVLAIKNDAAYLWGYTAGGEDLAVKASWDNFLSNQPASSFWLFDATRLITDAKDTIQNLSCVAINPEADFTLPAKSWTDLGE